MSDLDLAHSDGVQCVRVRREARSTMTESTSKPYRNAVTPPRCISHGALLSATQCSTASRARAPRSFWNGDRDDVRFWQQRHKGSSACRRSASALSQ